MKTDKENTRVYDKKTALSKAMAWCAYQERSQQELRGKLYDWQLATNEVEEIIATLISDNFLNEERFAQQYAWGKFRQKKWGKLKIKNGLRLKGVPARLIQKAIDSIDSEEYLQTLSELIAKKSAEINERNSQKKQFKLFNYVKSKGYENDLIFLLLKNKDL